MDGGRAVFGDGRFVDQFLPAGEPPAVLDDDEMREGENPGIGGGENAVGQEKLFLLLHYI